VSFWVPGFFFTQSFFTGIKQNFSRASKISIDEIEFRYEILAENAMIASAPEKGCYLFGLFIESARWNYKELCLDEP